MKRSLGWFLPFFVITVASGAALILLTPGAVDSAAASPVWAMSALGAVFAASAFVAWKVRPKLTPAE
ncbi:hypothetical protein [Microbacterium paludicola]|uniref:hypothetical protein n=1 Tax=Microbacterium paludicola TaxID=300019 RepID=UPI0011A8F98A|nr:hypothetical protein [Microbacterium paludicola]